MPKLLPADVRANSFTYCALFSACEKAAGAAWRVALEGLELLPRKRVMPEALLGNAVLSACGKAGHWIMAASLLADCYDLERDDVSFNAVLGGFGREECVGLWRSGQALFHTMRSEGLKVNLISCNSLMTILEKNRKWRHAHDLLAKGLHCFGVSEDAVTFNAMLSSYEKGQQWRSAQWQLACMKVSAMVSVVSLGACISAYGQASAWERAVCLYSNFVDFNLQANSVTCGAALTACERGRSWVLALRLVETKELQLGPVEMNAALTACSSSHVTDRALKFAQQMVSQRLQVDLVTFNAVLNLCRHDGLWFQSIELLKGRSSLGDFRHVDPDMLSFSATLAACAVAGRPYESFDLLMEAAASRITLDTQAVTNALEACHKRNLWQHVLHVASGTASDAALLQVCLDSADIAGFQPACVEFLDGLKSKGAEAIDILTKTELQDAKVLRVSKRLLSMPIRQAVGTCKTPVFGQMLSLVVGFVSQCREPFYALHGRFFQKKAPQVTCLTLIFWLPDLCGRWMGADVRRTFLLQDRGFQCFCVRCRGLSAQVKTVSYNEVNHQIIMELQ